MEEGSPVYQSNSRTMIDGQSSSYDHDSFWDREEDSVYAESLKKAQIQVQNPREVRRITCAKCVTFLALILGIAFSSAALSMYTEAVERHDFQGVVRVSASRVRSSTPSLTLALQFDELGEETLQHVNHHGRHIKSILQAWNAQISTMIQASPQTWPLVNIPDFQAQADHLSVATGATLVTIAPIVTSALLQEWNNFSATEAPTWIRESLDYTKSNSSIPDTSRHIFQDWQEPTPATEPLFGDSFLPAWQTAPVNDNTSSTINYDMFDLADMSQAFSRMMQTREPVILPAKTTEEGLLYATVLTPVFDSVSSDEIRAVTIGWVPWASFVEYLAPAVLGEVILLIRNPCGSSYTLHVNGQEVSSSEPDKFLKKKTGRGVSLHFNAFATVEGCEQQLVVYATDDFRHTFYSHDGLPYTISATTMIVLATVAFLLYVRLSQHRQEEVEITAKRSSAIVHSLFPETVRERLMKDTVDDSRKSATEGGGFMPNLPPHLRSVAGLLPDLRRVNPMRLVEELSNLALQREQGHEEDMSAPGDGKPIADLFPSATVLFGDIAGFTAWSSERQPAEVFTLLETIYNVFDQIANKKKVFKVETIGDCYMAATGLPEQRDDHAAVMAGFARQCMVKMRDVVKKLEVELGPGTGELAMRFGIHSGPVTAGVLRGEKSRFQLFGDTVNTASRMESTGQRHKIQISQSTAFMLVEAGMETFITPREDLVEAKGKGNLQTYWLTVRGSRTPVNHSDSGLSTNSSLRGEWNSAKQVQNQTDKVSRLIDWNVELLRGFIKKIVAIREDGNPANVRRRRNSLQHTSAGSFTEEVKEAFTLPKEPQKYKQNPDQVQLSEAVDHQLRDYVAAICAMYQQNDNHFHSFEHASHVTQSVTKMLARIVAPSAYVGSDDEADKQSASVALHRQTYGITSDPLMQFAVVFSALIHDVGHPGICNWQLIKEQSHLAAGIEHKSISEQHSVNLAWNLLMEDTYRELRRCVFSHQWELDKFREVLVNAVMSTDIEDTSLLRLRESRWNKAFRRSEQAESDEIGEEISDLKATITFECLVQASDLAHSMQHWRVFIRWNERLFHERFSAFQRGRAEEDPSEGWYQRELDLFNDHVIPLAAKLKECGVFGVTTDEYLTYARSNRLEWEMTGRELVEQYVKTYKDEEEDEDDDELVVSA